MIPECADDIVERYKQAGRSAGRGGAGMNIPVITLKRGAKTVTARNIVAIGDPDHWHVVETTRGRVLKRGNRFMRWLHAGEDATIAINEAMRTAR